MTELKTERERLPRWMKSTLPKGENYSKVKRLITEHHLNTICTSGNCPNKGECWNAGTASFMILGDKCTRNCRFCFVQNDVPEPVDWLEPLRLAKTIKTLGLKHCVITSVTRDDLPDGGAEFWATTIRKIKELNPNTTIETLIPDLNANPELIRKVIEAKPEVISHNMETVRRLTPKVRSTARYDRSLRVISIISEAGIVSKSGIMVGLGETEEEVLQTMDDLRAAGCKILTIGQYLQPDSNLLPVQEYIKPEIFEMYRTEGLKKGFSYVESSPLVRSSYHAERHVNG
ncbi:MAG TPA: lipoyl synthase [Prolixibacteraceae bacterium]|nr:lipoyl synthase [Prolixibacteraceae bacterium]